MSEETGGRAELYSSYLTFQTFLDDLKRDGIPTPIDNSTFGSSYSGTAKGQVLATLKGLGLIDAAGKKRPELEILVLGDKEEKQKTLTAILTRTYDYIFDGEFNLGTTSPGAFNGKFDFIKNNDTRRKAKTFFLRAAMDAGIDVSSRIQPSNRGTTSKKGSKKSAAGASSAPTGKTTGKTSEKNKRDEEKQGDNEPEKPIARDYWSEKFTQYLADLPPSNERTWTKRKRDRWITAITAMLDYFVEVEDQGDSRTE